MTVSSKLDWVLFDSQQNPNLAIGGANEKNWEEPSNLIA